MPTFKIFHSGTCIQTLQGADPTALSAAVAKAVQLAGSSKSTEAPFKTPGRTLGGDSAGRGGAGFDFGRFFNLLISFVGLYVVSFLSFDGQKAAEQSRFNVHNAHKRQPAPSHASASTSGSSSGSGSGAKAQGNSSRPQQRSAFKTLADL
ncbi:hypothetical protein QQS21_012701 [Conoideocrella luteorostrata]|uniref:Uncharacterized protein n=1 Tax=Conoideocrella luteorostrata TaxID=1105319 RepID=A0AAJ0CD09_9HYPO|nr:hypothetical protein QQS21_012701 [Conoideocrella luteorostrata]